MSNLLCMVLEVIGVAKLFIRDLREGDYVRSLFMVNDRNLISFKDRPGSFLNVTFVDRTGEISAVAWDNGPEFFRISNPGDIVGVGGMVKRYKGNLQIVIDELWTCKGEEYDICDFLASTPADVEKLKDFLFNVIDDMEDIHLKELLEYFFTDPHWLERFSLAPAGKRVHHGYLGGLIEHTVGVVKLALSICDIYPDINRDLLVAGAILHDIGKVEEYVYDRRIDFSDGGKLLGHIVIGERMVSQATGSLEAFPRELDIALRHMILSHHGEYEWGSPKKPKFLEACVLHHIDNLDAQINKFTRLIEDDQYDGDEWTSYDPTLGRSLYVGISRMTFSTKHEIAADEDRGDEDK